MRSFPDPKTDPLMGTLIGIARAADGNEHLITPASTAVILDGLKAVAGDPDDALLQTLSLRAQEVKRDMVPDCFLCACPCGKNSDYPMDKLRHAPAELRALKCDILRALAVLANRQDTAAESFYYRALFALGMDDWTAEELLPVLRQAQQLCAQDKG